MPKPDINDIRDWLSKLYEDALNRDSQEQADYYSSLFDYLNRLPQSPLHYKGMVETYNEGGFGDNKGLYDAIPQPEESYTKMRTFEANPYKTGDEIGISDLPSIFDLYYRRL